MVRLTVRINLASLGPAFLLIFWCVQKNSFFWPNNTVLSPFQLVKIITFSYGQGRGSWPPPPYSQPDRKISVSFMRLPLSRITEKIKFVRNTEISWGGSPFFEQCVKKTALFVAFLNANFNHFAILQTAPSTSTSMCLLLGALKTKIWEKFCRTSALRSVSFEKSCFGISTRTKWLKTVLKMKVSNWGFWNVYSVHPGYQS